MICVNMLDDFLLFAKKSQNKLIALKANLELLSPEKNVMFTMFDTIKDLLFLYQSALMHHNIVFI